MLTAFMCGAKHTLLWITIEIVYFEFGDYDVTIIIALKKKMTIMKI